MDGGSGHYNPCIQKICHDWEVESVGCFRECAHVVLFQGEGKDKLVLRSKRGMILG